MFVAIGETVRHAESERTARALAELWAEVHHVLEFGQVSDIESAVTSDAFLAAAARVLRDCKRRATPRRKNAPSGPSAVASNPVGPAVSTTSRE